MIYFINSRFWPVGSEHPALEAVEHEQRPQHGAVIALSRLVLIDELPQ